MAGWARGSCGGGTRLASLRAWRTLGIETRAGAARCGETPEAAVSATGRRQDEDEDGRPAEPGVIVGGLGVRGETGSCVLGVSGGRGIRAPADGEDEAEPDAPLAEAPPLAECA